MMYLHMPPEYMCRMSLKHCYFRMEDTLYKDYRLFVYAEMEYCNNMAAYPFVFDSNVFDSNFLVNNLVSCAVPPKGSSVYLFPNFPYAVNDVRTNYTIKRKPDTGDYNVVSTISPTSWSSQWIRCENLAVFPSKKIVVGYSKMKTGHELFTLAQMLVGDFAFLDEDEMIEWPQYTYFRGVSFDEPFKSFIRGTLTKPCVLANSLDRNAGQPLTVDVLELLYRTGKEPAFKDNLDKFILQANVLNQHDWRNCRGTISLLQSILEKERSSCYCEVSRTTSRYSKQIREFMQSPVSGVTSEEDLLLGQAFLDRLMDIGDERYVSLPNAAHKLISLGICEEQLNSFYDCVVRIKKREYAAN